MNCPYCGTKMEITEDRCFFCGKKIHDRLLLRISLSFNNDKNIFSTTVTQSTDDGKKIAEWSSDYIHDDNYEITVWGETVNLQFAFKERSSTQTINLKFNNKSVVSLDGDGISKYTGKLHCNTLGISFFELPNTPNDYPTYTGSFEYYHPRICCELVAYDSIKKVKKFAIES